MGKKYKGGKRKPPMALFNPWRIVSPRSAPRVTPLRSSMAAEAEVQYEEEEVIDAGFGEPVMFAPRKEYLPSRGYTKRGEK